MSDFIQNLKKNAEKLLDNAGSVTKATIKKTSESVNTLKLRYSVKDIESNISSIYEELGKMLYSEYRDGAEFTGEYLEKCEQITSHLEEIEILKTKIAELSDKQLCPDCGKYSEPNSKFCPSCGHEFEE